MDSRDVQIIGVSVVMSLMYAPVLDIPQPFLECAFDGIKTPDSVKPGYNAIKLVCVMHIGILRLYKHSTHKNDAY